MSLRSPLGTALGRGSGHSGVHHWIVQRGSAIALVPLTIWFLVVLIRLPLGDHAAVVGWVASGANPVLLALLVGLSAWHSQLGVQTVIEDWVHGKGMRAAGLLLSSGLHLLVGAAGVFAVVRIALRSFG
jgi:succinate dehydrogenase / fumarate reductase membrane anchor subunit